MIIIYTKIQIDIFNFHKNMCPQIFLKTKGGLFSKHEKCIFASSSNWRRILESFSSQNKSFYYPNLVIMPVDKNEHQRIYDVSTDPSSLTKASACTKPWPILAWLRVF